MKYFNANNSILAILSGDYYLFEDMDENLELNLLHEKPNVAVEDDVLKRNISKRRTFEEVCDRMTLLFSFFPPKKALSHYV